MQFLRSEGAVLSDEDGKQRTPRTCDAMLMIPQRLQGGFQALVSPGLVCVRRHFTSPYPTLRLRATKVPCFLPARGHRRHRTRQTHRLTVLFSSVSWLLSPARTVASFSFR